MTIEVSISHRLGSFTLDARFHVERPGITALFGPSGAGKTTIVNALAGLVRPKEGRIAIADRVVLDTRANLFVPARARRVGCVFQDGRLFPHMSVENNLRFGWRRAPDRSETETFADVVDLLGLELLLARRPARLSGGERSRVALGRALLSQPRLLLLDEPLAALDAARKAEIFPYLERLRDLARLPMIYVTHSPEEVARLADHAIVVKAGRLLAQGPVFDVLSDLEFGSLTGAPSFGAVFPAAVAAPRGDGLTALAFDGGQLLVPRIGHPAGTRLRVRLRAEDVMIAREAPAAISANNVLSATVIAVETRDDAHADVQLRCGGIKLVAHITRASLGRLAIVPGLTAFAIIKSVTVDPQVGAPP